MWIWMGQGDGVCNKFKHLGVIMIWGSKDHLCTAMVWDILRIMSLISTRGRCCPCTRIKFVDSVLWISISKVSAISLLDQSQVRIFLQESVLRQIILAETSSSVYSQGSLQWSTCTHWGIIIALSRLVRDREFLMRVPRNRGRVKIKSTRMTLEIRRCHKYQGGVNP